MRFIAQPGTRFTQSDQGIEIRGGPGLLRTNRFYADFVMRFQFQLVETDTEAVVFVRSLFANVADPPAVGYRIRLSAQDRRLGGVTGWRQRYSVAPAVTLNLNGASDEWHDCALRVVGMALTVRIDDVETTMVANLQELVGYVGFQTTRGRIRVRRVQLEPLPASGAPASNNAVELTEGIRNPSLIKDVRPVYSIETLRNRVQGVVVMRVVVRDDGTVGDVEVIKPLHPDLDQSAVAAARHWLFRPATKDGQPVAVYVTLEMRFKIDR